MNYSFGEDLKEKPEDIIQFKKGIEFWKDELLNINNLKEKAICNSKIGVHLRIVGELTASLIQLGKAKKIFETLPLLSYTIINEIRIAQTFQFLKRFSKATKLYEEIEKIIEANDQFSNLLHLVYQHKGKNYFDQRQFKIAKVHFEKALSIRNKMKDKSLVESSTYALEIVERYIDKNATT